MQNVVETSLDKNWILKGVILPHVFKTSISAVLNRVKNEF